MTDAVEFHDHLAGSWEKGYEKQGFAVRFRVLDELLSDENLQNQSWLDAGCGTGTLSRWLAEKKACRVKAVDASAAMLKSARAFANVEFQQANLLHLPFRDGEFDGVLCSSVLEYVDDPSAALKELRRVCRKGGLLLASVPRRSWKQRLLVRSFYWLTWPLGKKRMFTYLRHSKHSFRESEFGSLLSGAGFSSIKTIPFGSAEVELPFGIRIRTNDPPLMMAKAWAI